MIIKQNSPYINKQAKKLVNDDGLYSQEEFEGDSPEDEVKARRLSRQADSRLRKA